MSEAKENEQFYQAVRNGVYDAVMTIMEPQHGKRDLNGFLPAKSRPLDESREDILRAIKHGVSDVWSEMGQAQIDQMMADFKQSHGLPGEQDA